jgi:hypothetical protein
MSWDFGAYYYSHRAPRARRLRVELHTWSRGDGTVWVGGIIERHQGANVVAWFFPGRERSIPIATLEAAGLSSAIGSPIVCRFDEETMATGLELAGGLWPGRAGPDVYQKDGRRGARAYVEDGHRGYFSVIPWHLTTLSEYYDD